VRTLISLALAFILVFSAVEAESATIYRVGPGQPLADVGDVPWESIDAGDSILIHWRAAPYREKWVICRAGSESSPIVVSGVPGPGGELPVIDGEDATTRSALNFWSESRGVIKIGGANVPPDMMPAHIVIENLDIRGGRAGNTFTGRDGLTAYADNCAAIYIEKGENIVIRNCDLHDCGNGLFCSHLTTDLLVEGNRLYDCGNVGSIYHHNNYTEAKGIVFQFNYFGPPKVGADGNNLKDRSAGTVVRYNWIEGGNRQLDLVDSDFSSLIDDPRYRETFVYGNVLIEPDGAGNSQILHYGGDSGDPTRYRKGTLHFYHNTVISRRSGNTTLMRLSTDEESADCRNNILYVTANGNRLAMLNQDGSLYLASNWLKSGWVDSHSGGVIDITDAGQITGSDPGFRNAGADDFELAEGSLCIDAGTALLPAVLPDHEPLWEYVGRARMRARPVIGIVDLGAYEFTPTVAAIPGPRPRSGAVLNAAPNPFRQSCRIWIGGEVDAPADLQVLDASGRILATLPATPGDRGRWLWAPERRMPSGIYFLRSGNLIRRIIFIR
jgi:hypothetical protein